MHNKTNSTASNALTRRYDVRIITSVGFAVVIGILLLSIVGGWIGGRLAGLDTRESLWTGAALLPQAGVAVGMALIGEAAARYIGLSQPVSTGFVATLAYLGPRGAEALLAAWL